MPLKTARHSPNKMAAEISIPVPWKSTRLPKSLVSQIVIQFLFLFWQLPCSGALLTQIFFYQSWESWYSTALNTLTLESEKTSGLRELTFFKRQIKSTCLPNEQQSLMFPQKHFSWAHNRSLLAGYAENKHVFLAWPVLDCFFIWI